MVLISSAQMCPRLETHWCVSLPLASIHTVYNAKCKELAEIHCSNITGAATIILICIGGVGLRVKTKKRLTFTFQILNVLPS